MSKKHLISLGVLVVVVAFCGGGRLSRLFLNQSVQAQTGSVELRRWEYCTIVAFSWDSQRRVSTVTIGFHNARGTQLETWDGGPDNDPLSPALARLGAGGWECVGQFAYSYPGVERPNTWLFKRPKL